MNTIRFEQLKKTFLDQLDPRMSDETMSHELRMAIPTIKKIAASSAPMEKAEKSLLLIHKGKGTHAPLIWLGLKKSPSFGKQWMANCSTSRTAINQDEYVAELDLLLAIHP